MQVLVSGANGFIASHLVQQLLQAGHHVRGSVRNPNKQDSVAHLWALPHARERLELVAADLNDPQAFDTHVMGMDAVLHTASPYVLNVKDAQRDLVDPAVNGTRALLAACAAAPSVKRVVLTSSVAAITDEPDGRVLTEADWNTRSSLTRNPYYFSKAEAERAAWQFMQTQARHFDLVVINPFLVIGPSMTTAINTSNQVLVDMMTGKYPVLMSLVLGLVDVRDVALAHVQALTRAHARGRYLCANEARSMRQVADLLRRQKYEGARLPSLGMDNALGDTLMRLASYTQGAGVGSYLRTHLGRTVRFDNRHIQQDLGMVFRPMDPTIVDTVADLRRWGHV
jgi:dihydroflavonol-4-reductase